MNNLETNRKLMAKQRNTRRWDHLSGTCFFSWAQRVKTGQKTITFADKRISLLVIQIQEALWRKINNLKPLFSRNKDREVCMRGSILPIRNKTHRKSICISWSLSVKWKIRTLKSINYPPERENSIGTRSIIFHFSTSFNNKSKFCGQNHAECLFMCYF